MGLDVRDLPPAAAETLPDRLRAAGFAVAVTREPCGRVPGATAVRVHCHRGDDVQPLFWLEGVAERAECRVVIPNAWAWRPWVRDRRARLQADVTAVIEQAGGRFPER